MEEQGSTGNSFFCAEMEDGSFTIGIMAQCEEHGLHPLPMLAIQTLAHIRCLNAVITQAIQATDQRAGLPSIVRLSEEILQALTQEGDLPGIPGAGL